MKVQECGKIQKYISANLQKRNLLDVLDRLKLDVNLKGQHTIPDSPDFVYIHRAKYRTRANKGRAYYLKNVVLAFRLSHKKTHKKCVLA